MDPTNGKGIDLVTDDLFKLGIDFQAIFEGLLCMLDSLSTNIFLRSSIEINKLDVTGMISSVKSSDELLSVVSSEDSSTGIVNANCAALISFYTFRKQNAPKSHTYVILTSGSFIENLKDSNFKGQKNFKNCDKIAIKTRVYFKLNTFCSI